MATRTYVVHVRCLCEILNVACHEHLFWSRVKWVGPKSFFIVAGLLVASVSYT